MSIYSSSISEEEQKHLLAPYEYILRCPGKEIRPKLLKAFNYWLKISDSKVDLIGRVVEMLHNASLLIDDIEDDSVLRRGVPVAHHIFGIPTTINTANYVYFLSLKIIIDEFPAASVADAVKIFTEQLIELHQGQGMDIHWRDTYQCPSQDEYLSMIRRKTGGLFGLGVRLMQLFSDERVPTRPTDGDIAREIGKENVFAELIANMGSFFQIRDDYANLKSSEYEDNKSYCEDLSEGKFSFPIIHAINEQERRGENTVMNIVRKRPTKSEIKKYAVEEMDRLGSFDYTRHKLRELELQIRSNCETLGGNPFLVELVDYLMIRE